MQKYFFAHILHWRDKKAVFDMELYKIAEI